MGGLREDIEYRVFIRLINDKDRLLYDFTREVGDTIWYNAIESFIQLDYVVIESIDSVFIGICKPPD